MTAPSSRFALLLGLALVCLGRPAHAKSKVLPVAVALTPDAQDQTAEVAYILESAVRRSSRHVFVDPVDKFDPDGVTQREVQREKADNSMAYGKKSYVNLENGLGIESFDRAIRAYEKSALWEDFDGLVQAKVMHILVKWADDQAATKKEIAELIAIAPHAVFPPDLTPPDLAAELASARRRAHAATRFGLDVSTRPVGARAYVDGVYRGTTPTTVRGLVPGEHYLSLVAPGYVVSQQLVRAGPGATATVTLQPADRAKPFLTFLDRIRSGFGDNAEVTAAQVLARASGADELFVAGLSRSSSRLTVTFHRIAARDGHALATDQLELNVNDPDFAARIDDIATRLLAKDQPRGPHGEPAPLKSQFQEALNGVTHITPAQVRLGVGVGAAALFAAGVVTGLVARSEDGNLRSTVQTNATVDQQISTTFDTALTADLLMGSGLVAGCVWAWLQFGAKFAKETDIEAPPSLGTSPDSSPQRRQKKKSDDDDDPFGGQISEAPSWNLFALPGLDGATFGLKGTF